MTQKRPVFIRSEFVECPACKAKPGQLCAECLERRELYDYWRGQQKTATQVAAERDQRAAEIEEVRKALEELMEYRHRDGRIDGRTIDRYAAFERLIGSGRVPLRSTQDGRGIVWTELIPDAVLRQGMTDAPEQQRVRDDVQGGQTGVGAVSGSVGDVFGPNKVSDLDGHAANREARQETARNQAYAQAAVEGKATLRQMWSGQGAGVGEASGTAGTYRGGKSATIPAGSVVGVGLRGALAEHVPQKTFTRAEVVTVLKSREATPLRGVINAREMELDTLINIFERME